jgi:hypothetical protein
VSVLVSYIYMYIIRCDRCSFGHSTYLSGCNTIQLSIHFAVRKVRIDFVVVVVIVAKNCEIACQHVLACEGTLHSLP